MDLAARSSVLSSAFSSCAAIVTRPVGLLASMRCSRNATTGAATPAFTACGLSEPYHSSATLPLRSAAGVPSR